MSSGSPHIPLGAGTKVGPYEILSVLGAGGMGEVYRARDERLNRDVAVKVLRPALIHDPDRLARFRREAQLLAALNHPNIAHVHGLEDAGGHPALIMELVEGLTLADRLAAGPMALDDALPIARQIVEALEAAHATGIIHRDLKPANIKVRNDGTVKVLDFGLAKALEPEGAAGAGATSSPTISMHATAAGIIMGTAAYMSPEQARGRAVDRRADVWAFGAVLYEMLTARRAFDADDMSDTLALVLTKDPDWTALPASTPTAIRRLLRRCLERDVKRRLPDIAVARLEIDESLATPSSDAAAGVTTQSLVSTRAWRLLLPFAAGAALTALVMWGAVWSRSTESSETSPLTRFGITLPADGQIALSFNDRDLAISPDGTRVVYTAGPDAQLMVRALDRLDPLPLAGVTNARGPFVSPDGRWIGFFDRLDEGITTGPVVSGALKRVPIDGGPATTIATISGGSRGASWGPDDAIVFATNDRATGLLRVAARGGEPEVLTRPDASRDERDHQFPSLLPGGRAVLFTIVSAKPNTGGRVTRVAALDLETREWRVVLPSGSQATYVDTGHLVYEDGAALWAARFDLNTLSVVGDPMPMLEQVTTREAAANLAVSRQGTLVYAPSAGVGDARSLVWIDRRGNESAVGAPQHAYNLPRLSPDGTRVAVHISDGRGGEFWIWDFSQRRLSPMRSGSEGAGWFSTWSPDSRYLFVGAVHVFRRAADGTGVDEHLTGGPVAGRRPMAVTPNSTHLIYEQQTASGAFDLMLLPLRDPGKGAEQAVPLLNTPADERNASIAPNGRWIAYESNKTGQFQIYVKPFPNVNDAEYQVSTAGGRTPLFARDGRELFFVSGSRLMTAPVQFAPTFTTGNPTVLINSPSIIFDGRLLGSTGRTYEVSRDGNRFLLLKDDAAVDRSTSRPGIIVVQNWFRELNAKLPIAK